MTNPTSQIQAADYGASHWSENIAAEADKLPKKEFVIQNGEHQLAFAKMVSTHLADRRFAMSAELQYFCGDHKSARLPWIAFPEQSEGIRFFIDSAKAHFENEPTHQTQLKVRQEILSLLQNPALNSELLESVQV